jgi:hypothetical protein
VLLKERDLKRYLIDFLAMNLVTLAISFLLYFTGREIVGTFIVCLFLESAFVLILGGVFGSLMSSASYYALEKFFGGRGSKGKEEDVPQKEAAKKNVATGKRFVILGIALLVESILIALMLI